MHSPHYKNAKKEGLKDLLKQMQGRMAKGHGDKPMHGADVAEAVDDAEKVAHEVCEHCDGEGCEHCPPEHGEHDAEDLADGGADEAAEGDDQGEHGDEHDDHKEPDFKQHVRDFLSNKKRARPAKKSLIVREIAVAAPLPKGMPEKSKGFPKKRA